MIGEGKDKEAGEVIKGKEVEEGKWKCRTTQSL